MKAERERQPATQTANGVALSKSFEEPSLVALNQEWMHVVKDGPKLTNGDDCGAFVFVEWSVRCPRY